MGNGQLNGRGEDQRHPERDVSPQGPPPDYDDNGSDHHTDGSFLPVGFQVVIRINLAMTPVKVNTERPRFRPRTQANLPT